MSSGHANGRRPRAPAGARALSSHGSRLRPMAPLRPQFRAPLFLALALLVALSTTSVGGAAATASTPQVAPMEASRHLPTPQAWSAQEGGRMGSATQACALPATVDPSSCPPSPSVPVPASTGWTTSPPVGEFGTIVRTLNVGAGWGSAYDSATGMVYVLDYGSGTVNVVSDTTDTVVATVAVGVQPTEAAYDPANGDIYVVNSDCPAFPCGGANVSVISGATNQVVASIPVVNQPYGIAYDSGTGELYVSAPASNAVEVINGSLNQVTLTVSLLDPLAIAYDSANQDIYVTELASDQVAVLDGTTHLLIANVGVGSAPEGLGVDTATGQVFVANEVSNNVSIITGTPPHVIANVPTDSEPVQASYDRGNGNVYVTSFGSNNLTLISGATDQVASTLDVGGLSWGEAYDGGTGQLFVQLTNTGPRNLVVVSTLLEALVPSSHLATPGTGWPLATFSWGGTYAPRPGTTLFDPDNGDIYVVTPQSMFVDVLSGATGAVLSELFTGYFPMDLAYDSANGDIYIINNAGTGSGYGSIAVVSGATNQIQTTITVYLAPIAIAYDASNGDLYVEEQQGILDVFSGATNQNVASIALNSYESLGGVAYDSENADIYVTTGCGSGTGGTQVEVISSTTNKVISTIPLSGCASRIAYDGGNGDLYVVDTAFNNVDLISGSTNRLLGELQGIGQALWDIVYDSGNGNLYVTDSDGGPTHFGVVAISGVSNRVVGHLNAGENPQGIAYDPQSGELFVSNLGGLGPTLSVFSTLVEATPPLPGAITVDEGQSLLLSMPVPAWGSGSVRSNISASPVGGLSCGVDPLDLARATGACVAETSGTYTVSITVKDSLGNQVASTATVVVLSPTTVAVPVASSSSLALGQSLTFSTAASGGTGAYPAYLWRESSPYLNCTLANSPSISCHPTRTGSTFTVSVQVNDSNDLFSPEETSASVNVSSAPPPLSATASALPVVGTAPLTVALNGSASGGLPPFQWAWRFGDGQAASSRNPTHSFAVPGVYSVRMWVNDSAGDLATSSVQVTVSSSSTAPAIISFSPSASTVTNDSSLEISVVVGGLVGPVAYRYLGLPPGCGGQDSPVLVCTPTVPGSYLVRVYANDSYGDSVTGTLQLTVSGPAASQLPAPPATTSSPLTLAETEGVLWGLLGTALLLAAILVGTLYARRRSGGGEGARARSEGSPTQGPPPGEKRAGPESEGGSEAELAGEETTSAPPEGQLSEGTAGSP